MATDPAPPPASEIASAKPALESVTFENYRCFKKYRMDGLKRVNLLVGKNGSGKTAALVGIGLLETGGSVDLLIESAVRRGEARVVPAGNGQPRFDASRLTWEQRTRIGSSIEIFSDICANARLSLRFGGLDDIRSRSLIGHILEGRLKAATSFIGEWSRTGSATIEIDHALTDDWISVASEHRLKDSGSPAGDDGIHRSRANSCMVHAGAFPDANWMAELWKKVYDAKREDILLDALRLLDPEISDIGLDDIMPWAGHGLSTPPFKVNKQSLSRRVSIATLGDGFARLLVHSLALEHTAGGSLFIDEIDTGLHYSVMADMWKLVIATARKLNVQVFATTHSWDCIEGLAEACRRDESFLPEVAVHSIHRHLPESLPHDGESILDISRYNLDPR